MRRICASNVMVSLLGASETIYELLAQWRRNILYIIDGDWLENLHRLYFAILVSSPVNECPSIHGGMQNVVTLFRTSR